MLEQTAILRILPLDRDTIKLLRIRFSYFLMPVFFFALSQARDINWVHVVICFIALHLFIYPASNGYNSYMDQDKTSIGGLEHPPLPTRKLFYASLVFDIIGLSLALIVNVFFFAGVLVYILASRAYSFKGIRLKKYPIAGFLTVVFFQGAVTFWMIFSGVSSTPFQFNYTTMSVLAACSFLIGGVYPLTQVYQHTADSENGDMTISRMLGVVGTFVFSTIMFACADILFYFYFKGIDNFMHFLVLQLFLFPVIVYFNLWFLSVLKDNTQASFKKTMRMNLVASTCMNACFITLLILNLNK